MSMKEDEKIAFELILHAGDARSKSIEAIYLSRDGKENEALQLLKEAREDLRLAHQTQTSLLTNEAQGINIEPTILLVHAQDHLAMAISAIDNAEEMINLYSITNKLKERLNNLTNKD